MSLPIRTFIILSALLSISIPAYAESVLGNVRVVAGASLGYTNYAFPAKLDHDINSPSASLIAAATRNRWQLALNGTFSLEDADVSEEEDVGKASRQDIDLTLGYQFNQHWSAFVGYKSGETEIEYVSRAAEDEGIAVSMDERYKQEGPYVGGSYSWQFEKAGRISVTLAYAMLDATNEFRANTDDDEPEDDIEFDDMTGRVKGDTTGFSYGVSWTMPLSGNLLFQTRFKMNDYQQDIQFEGQDFNNIDESYVSLMVGLAYVF